MKSGAGRRPAGPDLKSRRRMKPTPGASRAGTEIVLHLKPEAKEYLEGAR